MAGLLDILSLAAKNNPISKVFEFGSQQANNYINYRYQSRLQSNQLNNSQTLQDKQIANSVKLQNMSQNFQEHMSSTQFQRSARDAKAAGFNPALAMTSGSPAMIKAANDNDFRQSIMDTVKGALNHSKGHLRVANLRPK